jgi:hypothetical protein
MIASLVLAAALLLAGQVVAPNEARASCGRNAIEVTVCSGGKQFVGIIDQLGVSPAFDMSVARCLTKNWLGKAIVNIRRASDNATKDIVCLASGQNIGNLDAAAFNTFCAATTCFATKGYDQSGNARDASQSTAANQPQLTLNTIGGKPALNFNGSSTALATTASFALGTVNGWTAVAERLSGTGFQPMITASGGASGLWFNNAANKIATLGTGGAVTLIASATDAASHSLTVSGNGASSFISVDGTVTTGNNSGLTNVTQTRIIGGMSSTFWNGVGSEIIEWGFAPSQAQSAIVHLSQSAYYGTP